MTATHVRERDGARRCAFCHDALDEPVVCSGCGTALHRECRAELGSCPTLGCPGEAPPAFVPPPLRHALRISAVTAIPFAIAAGNVVANGGHAFPVALAGLAAAGHLLAAPTIILARAPGGRLEDLLQRAFAMQFCLAIFFFAPLVILATAYPGVATIFHAPAAASGASRATFWMLMALFGLPPTVLLPVLSVRLLGGRRT